LVSQSRIDHGDDFVVALARLRHRHVQAGKLLRHTEQEFK